MWQSYGLISRRNISVSGSTLTLLWFISWHKLILNTCGVMGQSLCYECVWQSSDAKIQDVCTPGHFNPDVVYKAKCPYGCITTVLYEYDLEMPTTTTARPGQNSNGTSKPPMTFYLRGCPKDDRPRSKTGCEEKSYQNVYQEECFCTSDLCNGSNGNRSSREPFCFWITISSLSLFTFFAAASSSSGLSPF